VKPKDLRFIALGLLVSIALLNIAPNAALADPSTHALAQIVEPFEEMLPGVYVASMWWNESGSDLDWTFDAVEPGYGGQVIDDIYEYTFYVEDTNGTGYYVLEESVSDWSYNWSFSNLFVTIILDPDGSYMSWLANQGLPDEARPMSDPETPVLDILPDDPLEEPVEETDSLWYIFWTPEPEAMTGDEVFIYSSFYFSEDEGSSYYAGNYSWFTEEMDPVDPNDIIPNLAEEYYWAAYMNESYEYDYSWDYAWYGYDVNEMFIVEDEVRWMEHYFAGLSVFNDTDGDGIMDIVYSEYEYDFDGDGKTDWVYYGMNETASELVYEFYANQGDVGDIVMPHINADNQIEWSAEVVDIEGDFWSTMPFAIWCYECGPEVSLVEPEVVPVALDRFEMVYRFEVTEDAAVLKIDQHIGDFTDPVSGTMLPEAEGLSLALNYWSSFSSYTVTAENEQGAEVAPDLLEADDAPAGTLYFEEEEVVRTTVEFGGTYVWGYDGATYDVGTAVMPMYFYAAPYVEGVPASELSYDTGSWMMATYYYSSCYSNWDGYAVIHDPVFAAYPAQRPGDVSNLINDLMNASWAVAAIGVVAIGAVCVRTNRVRKSV